MTDEFLGREFSEDELSKALEHLKARWPEALSMIEQRELGRLVVERDKWKDIMFKIVSILDEIGLTANLFEAHKLLLTLRREIRKRLRISG